MSSKFPELQKLLELLHLEKQEDYAAYQKEIENQPLSERREQGSTWLPVKVVKSGFAIGERAFVIVERTNMLNKPHQFRAGMPVRFYTLYADAYKPEIQGVINFAESNRMKIVLSSKELPEWINLDQIGVDLLFDGRTYVEMERALKIVTEANNNRLAELRDVLLGKLPPKKDDFRSIPDLPMLNPSQQEAVRQVIASNDVAVIHGPPGTGKTTTLVQAVRLLAQSENNILVTAPSNTAADLLTERLAAENLRVVRIGHISRVDDLIIKHTLEAQLAAHPESKHIKKVKIEAAEARRQARKFKRRFDGEARREREHLKQQARELAAWANQLEDRLLDQILDGAQVIISTLVGVTHKALDKRIFRTVFIDEAAQALEPATWIPVTKASRVVLAGDPFQLPPTVKSFEAQRGGLSVTLIEKCLGRLPNLHLLTVQYRMHQAIMNFSNRQFYNGILTAHDSVEWHSLEGLEHPPVIFIDTAGCGFEEKINKEAQSRYNPEEFMILCEHLYQLCDQLDKENFPGIALISPYREQVLHMRTALDEDSKLQNLPVQVNTIDGFQGQERDVIYISLVRSNNKAEIGFLNDYRRMNVAMTRARKLLVVVGDSGTIGANPFYADFLNYVEKEGAYLSAWEYMR